MNADWDIMDSVVPKVSRHELNPFTDWPDGHCRRVYLASDEDVKKHTSGWAMRNTNNHNVNILKKSCLGVILCSADCTTSNGSKIRIRPAICDKARKKQRDKPCPNVECQGQLIVKACHGHCGYPVTHFWRTGGEEVYFQAKGTHDHPRPEPKGCHMTKQLYAKRKSSNTAGLVAQRHRSAITKRLRSLGSVGIVGNSSSRIVKSASASSTIADRTVGNDNTVIMMVQPPPVVYIGNSANAPTTMSTAVAFNNGQSTQTWTSSTSTYPSASSQFSQQQSDYSQIQQQQPQSQQQRLQWPDYCDTSDYTSSPDGDEYLRPEDIFQLDQPIKSQQHSSPQQQQQQHHHQHQHQEHTANFHQQQQHNQSDLNHQQYEAQSLHQMYNNYASSTYSNGMSPMSSSSLSSPTSSSTSESPPFTFLDLESGRIHANGQHQYANQSHQQQPQQQHHHHQHHQQHPHLQHQHNNSHPNAFTSAHLNTNSNDSASISNEFDDSYMHFQVQNADYGMLFGIGNGQHQHELQHQQQHNHNHHHLDQPYEAIDYAPSPEYDMVTGAVDWASSFSMQPNMQMHHDQQTTLLPTAMASMHFTNV